MIRSGLIRLTLVVLLMSTTASIVQGQSRRGATVQSSATPAPRQQEEPPPPPPPPPAAFNAYVGEIVQVDEDARTAVVLVHGSGIIPRGLLVVRNPRMEPTAILESTPLQRGNLLGVGLVDGVPAIGQEVIIPGPALMTRIIRGDQAP